MPLRSWRCPIGNRPPTVLRYTMWLGPSPVLHSLFIHSLYIHHSFTNEFNFYHYYSSFTIHHWFIHALFTQSLFFHSSSIFYHWLIDWLIHPSSHPLIHPVLHQALPSTQSEEEPLRPEFRFPAASCRSCVLIGCWSCCRLIGGGINWDGNVFFPDWDTQV